VPLPHTSASKKIQKNEELQADAPEALEGDLSLENNEIKKAKK